MIAQRQKHAQPGASGKLKAPMLFGAFLGGSCACTACAYEGSRLLNYYTGECVPPTTWCQKFNCLLLPISGVSTHCYFLLCTAEIWRREKRRVVRGLKTYHPFPDEALRLAGQQRSEVESGLTAQGQLSLLGTSLLWLPGYSGCQGSFGFVAVLNELHFYISSQD